MIDVGDIKYLAGLLEGEGCFSFGNNPVIQLYMTDLDVIEKARKILKHTGKIGVIEGRPNCKTQYRVIVTGNDAVEWMFTLYSLMGIRRKGKIREIVQKWKEMAGRGGNISKKQREIKAIKAIAISRKISFEEAREIFHGLMGNSTVQ